MSKFIQKTASDLGLHYLQIVQNHFYLGISKLHNLTYLKLKLESSNISCGWIHSVYNGLKHTNHQQYCTQCSSWWDSSLFLIPSTLFTKFYFCSVGLVWSIIQITVVARYKYFFWVLHENIWLFLVFFCLFVLVFMAYSTQWGHIKHGQSTYPHFYWADLVL